MQALKRKSLSSFSADKQTFPHRFTGRRVGIVASFPERLSRDPKAASLQTSLDRRTARPPEEIKTRSLTYPSSISIPRWPSAIQAFASRPVTELPQARKLPVTGSIAARNMFRRSVPKPRSKAQSKLSRVLERTWLSRALRRCSSISPLLFIFFLVRVFTHKHTTATREFNGHYLCPRLRPNNGYRVVGIVV